MHRAGHQFVLNQLKGDIHGHFITYALGRCCHCAGVAIRQPLARHNAVPWQGGCRVQKGVQGIEDDVKTPVNRIEGPPSQVEAKEEGKASDGEPILR